jgi:hypothetical protein
MYPVLLTVIAMSSSAIRSSMRNSPSSARISVRRGSLYFFLHRAQLVDDDLHHQPVAGENRHQALDQLQQLGELGEDLFPLEAGQPLELHVEDRLGLICVRLNCAIKPSRASAGFADRGSAQSPRRGDRARSSALEDVPARFRLPQLVLGSPADDLSTELDEALESARAVTAPSAAGRRSRA